MIDTDTLYVYKLLHSESCISVHNETQKGTMVACCWSKTCCGKTQNEFMYQNNQSREWCLNCDAIVAHIGECDYGLHEQLLYVDYI